MSNRSNDELAAALAGLHSGDHVEPDEHPADDHHAHLTDDAAHTAPAAPVPYHPPAAPIPVPAAPPSARPPMPRAAAPVAAPRPAAPIPQPRPAAAPRQTRPAAPMPAAPAPATPARPSRPPAPQQPVIAQVPPPVVQAQAQFVAPAEPEEAPTVDTSSGFDDDAVMVPAPTMAQLNPIHTPLQSILRLQKIERQRTIIPIFLGVMISCLALGACQWVCGDDTALGSLPIGYTIGFLAMAAVSAAFAGVSMLTLSKLISDQAAPAAMPAAG